MNEITNVISKFEGQTRVDHRYATYDFCYLYFKEYWCCCASTERMHTSCMVLWSYLASWGMLRGSSFLLQKSPAYLKPLIEYVQSEYSKLSEIDVDNYTYENIQILLNAYNSIEKILKGNPAENNHPSSTLITKIMLGVFGNVPAFDTYFCETFGKLYTKGFTSKTVSKNTLEFIRDFYDNNKEDIDQKKIYAIRFDGTKSLVLYKKAKLIDMYGFQKGISEYMAKVKK